MAQSTYARPARATEETLDKTRSCKQKFIVDSYLAISNTRNRIAIDHRKRAETHDIDMAERLAVAHFFPLQSIRRINPTASDQRQRPRSFKPICGK